MATNLSEEQISNLEKLIDSNNDNDVILACQLIYNNKPFNSWRTLTKKAKRRLDYLTQKSRKVGPNRLLWINPIYQQWSDNYFLTKILKIPMSKTLYKKDSSGNTRYLKIWTEGSDLVQESGVVGTDNPLEHRKPCKPKNVGKSNATTGEQQAKLEMKSKIAEKLKEDYFEKLEDAKNGKVILPMLAKTYKDHKHKIDWDNAFIQPKLDGMRALAIIKDGDVKLISRQGTEITTCDHVVQTLKNQNFKDIVFDGELYCHGIGFQNNMKLVKKYRPGETENIIYNIYDVVLDKPFEERMQHFPKIKGKGVEVIFTYTLLNEDELRDYHQNNIKDGYEGSMIRWGNEGYKINGRSENLLKYKDFQDIALKIIDITPNDANPKHGTPWFELKGKKFKSGVKLSHEDREDLLTNKDQYIGKTAELRYFELSDDGICRFPVMVGIRLDK